MLRDEDRYVRRYAEQNNSLWRRIILFFFTFNSEGYIMTSLLLVFLEVLICLQIIWQVPYTEIDWSTYMQQVRCYINGERNYTLIKGDTGPIVYPAGHLLIYRLLYAVTNQGHNIRAAQYIFAMLYLANLIAVFRLFYQSRRLPPFALVLMCLTSYRIHSIYMLRLFNDPIAVFLFFVAVNLWTIERWVSGCVFYSLAVSVKMNILLYAPAVLFILLLSNDYHETFALLSICTLIQLGIAVQFIVVDPISYFKRAFELSRIFLFEWTVNWRFLPEWLFVSRFFHLLLLVVHLALIVYFVNRLWFRSQGGAMSQLRRLAYGIRTRLDVHDLLVALFTANLAGIAFARSLHYQFYSWYYYSLIYLLFAPISRVVPRIDEEQIWRLPLLLVVPAWKIFYRVILLLIVELCWITFPSTSLSSVALHMCHAIIIVLVMLTRPPLPQHLKTV